MKLTDEDKFAFREAAAGPAEEFRLAASAPLFSPEDYFRQVEEWAKLIPPPPKPVAFEGDSWRL